MAKVEAVTGACCRCAAAGYQLLRIWCSHRSSTSSTADLSTYMSHVRQIVRISQHKHGCAGRRTCQRFAASISEAGWTAAHAAALRSCSLTNMCSSKCLCEGAILHFHVDADDCRCQEQAQLQCPKCKELGMPKHVSVFCSQDCFKAAWAGHKHLHKASSSSYMYVAGGGVSRLTHMPSFSWTGSLRPYRFVHQCSDSTCASALQVALPYVCQVDLSLRHTRVYTCRSHSFSQSSCHVLHCIAGWALNGLCLNTLTGQIGLQPATPSRKRTARSNSRFPFARQNRL
jgi:zf-MYND-like zinc finger, mRNA-binding